MTFGVLSAQGIMPRGRFSNTRGRTYRSTRTAEGNNRDLRLYFPEEMLWFFREYGIEIRGLEPAIEPPKPDSQPEEPKDEGEELS